MLVNEIFNYKRISDKLSLAGQPKECELIELSESGFEVVINIAPTDSRYSLKDEEGLVEYLGMEYFHLPVDFAEPTESDFEKFCMLVESQVNKQVFIHCAANYRVTVFYALYAMKYGILGRDAALSVVSSIWNLDDFPVWKDFFERVMLEIEASADVVGS